MGLSVLDEDFHTIHYNNKNETWSEIIIGNNVGLVVLLRFIKYLSSLIKV